MLTNNLIKTYLKQKTKTKINGLVFNGKMYVMLFYHLLIPTFLMEALLSEMVTGFDTKYSSLLLVL